MAQIGELIEVVHVTLGDAAACLRPVPDESSEGRRARRDAPLALAIPTEPATGRDAAGGAGAATALHLGRRS